MPFQSPTSIFEVNHEYTVNKIPHRKPNLVS